MSQRLYVGNLSFRSSEESLRAAFSEAGDVTEVRIVTDRDSGQSRGFAFVTMGSPEAGRKAIATLNGVFLDGRPLRVNEAEERGRPGAPSRGGERQERQVFELAEGEIGNPRPGGHRGW